MKTIDLPGTGNNMIGSDSLIGFMTRQDTALVEDQRVPTVQVARQMTGFS